MSDSKLLKKNTGLFLYGQRNIFVVSDKKGWSHDRGVSM